MKIALLQADHIPSHRRNISGGNYPEMFSNLFLKVDAIVDIDTFDVTIGEYPENESQYNGFIISGSKSSAYSNEAWISKLKLYICKLKDDGHKLVGICFGHQVIAEALGGKVEYAGHKGVGIGVQTVHMQKRLSWMQPFEEYMSLLFNHYDQVVTAPENAEVLAYNDFCEVQMYHINHQVFGVQAHPEMIRAHNHLLIKELENQGVTDDIQSAVDTLRLRDHSMIVGMWMVRFFEE